MHVLVRVLVHVKSMDTHFPRTREVVFEIFKSIFNGIIYSIEGQLLLRASVDGEFDQYGVCLVWFTALRRVRQAVKVDGCIGWQSELVAQVVACVWVRGFIKPVQL